jgi:hypothetical protein
MKYMVLTSISSHFTTLSEEHYSTRTYLMVPLHDGLHDHLQLHPLHLQGLELRWQRLLRPVSMHRCLRRPAPDHYLKTFLLLLRSKERPWRWPLAGEPFQPGTSGDYHTRTNHANQRYQHKNRDSVPRSPTPVCANYERWKHLTQNKKNDSTDELLMSYIYYTYPTPHHMLQPKTQMHELP